MLLPGQAALGPSLKSRAASRGLLFGTMVAADRLACDPEYAAAILRECAVIVPGTEAKWATTEPEPGHFDFASLDHIADFARVNALQLRLHNLVWAVWNPPWLAPALAAGEGGHAMRRHIETVAGHMRGRCLAWDVLNEPADPRWPSGPDGLCTTGWWHAMGPSYADRAFNLARQADPGAKLFVNDDWLEYPQCREKRLVYLKLIESWRKRGVPIDGFGLEAHLRPEIPFDALPYRVFLKDLASLGLIIHVTELDVQDRALPADRTLRDRIVADTAGRFLDVVLDEPAVRAVLCWGLAHGTGSLDLDPATRRADGLMSRGAPLDRAMRPTAMYHAIARAFDGAPGRTG